MAGRCTEDWFVEPDPLSCTHFVRRNDGRRRLLHFQERKKEVHPDRTLSFGAASGRLMGAVCSLRDQPANKKGLGKPHIFRLHHSRREASLESNAARGLVRRILDTTAPACPRFSGQAKAVASFVPLRAVCAER